MVETFCLINTKKSPTREESLTIGRQIGEEFLRQYIGEKNMTYCGLIAEHGQIVPFWRINGIPINLTGELEKLKPNGYYGKIRSTSA